VNMKLRELQFLDYFHHFGGAQRSTVTLVLAIRSLGIHDCRCVSILEPPAEMSASLGPALSVLRRGMHPPLGRLSWIRRLAGVLSDARVLRAYILNNSRGHGIVFVTSSVKALATILVARMGLRRGPRVSFYCRGEGLSSQYSYAERLLIRFTVDRYLAVSQATASNMSAWGVDHNNIRVVHTSVDVSSATERAESVREHLLKDRPLVICFIGSLIPLKGLDLLIEAIRLQRSNRKTLLLVAGATPGPNYNEFFKHCQVLAGACGPMREVSWLGRVASPWEVLAASDLLCLPSKSEGLPRVVIEAMAAGRPVVACKAGGTMELVRDGWNGWLVDRDARALADVLDELSTVRDLPSFGIRARSSIAVHVCPERQARRVLEALYDLRTSSHWSSH
jgi:glycosyltransferase involved in cell wall biosynthesis